MAELTRGLDHLDVWQRALAFAQSVYADILPQLPVEEKYGLASQLRRAAQSIPANIAEGYGRYHYLDAVRFCYIARGSLEETYSHVVLAHRLNYLSDATYQKLVKEYQALRQLINGYIAYLKREKIGSGEPGPSIHDSDVDYQVDGPLAVDQ